MNIDINQTHIKLKTDLVNHSLESYIFKIRSELEAYILSHNDFLISLDNLNPPNEDLPEIVRLMYLSSKYCNVGPMASVAGTISELSLNYLIAKGSKNSIVENGGDIAIINNKKVLCGIYSNNPFLENKIAFKLKPSKKARGICTSSGKIGHSISFGESDCVCVLSKHASIADGLATRIANDVLGVNSHDSITNALETCEMYSELFTGVLIICGSNIGTIGKLPKIVSTQEFYLDKI